MLSYLVVKPKVLQHQPRNQLNLESSHIIVDNNLDFQPDLRTDNDSASLVSVLNSSEIVNDNVQGVPDLDMFFSNGSAMVGAHSTADEPVAESRLSQSQFQSKTANSLKWKTETYSRHQRKMRSLEIYDRKQPKITTFMEVVDKIKEMYSKEKLETDSESDNCSMYKDLLSISLSNRSGNHEGNHFLELLKDTAMRNVEKEKHGKRFSGPLKLFSLYLYIVSGRLAYETLYKNLQNALPSLSTVHRTLDEGERILEGQVRMFLLKEYLVKRKLPLSVFISEDQTAIVQTVQYESKINKMVGFVLPLHTQSGFPELDKFTVDSVSDIEKAFKDYKLSKTAYFFMAQPLKKNVPAFCLCVFGSDNKFSAEDVRKRWKYLVEEAKFQDIEVVGFSSDGDSRCLKSMKIESRLPSSLEDGSSCPYKPYFQMDFNTEKPIYIQDTVHIGTKLKTRFLKVGINLPMGKFEVSVSHIEALIETVSKDQHLLCKSLLDGTDKMNFGAIDKITSRKVIQLIQKIDKSNATRQYLLLTRNILDSYLDKNIDHVERIYLIWNSIFFCRGWKEWLKNNNLSTSKNFLTSNTYTCIELNGHSLLLLIEKCRNSVNGNLDGNMILPWLCSSQPCEKSFRQTRSMTSTFSTIVNFSMSDIMSRLKRIQALNEISCDLSDSFIFPREQEGRLGKKHINVEESNMSIPSVEEINIAITSALNDAKEALINLGMCNIQEEAFLKADICNLNGKNGEKKREVKNAFEVESTSVDNPGLDKFQSQPRSEVALPELLPADEQAEINSIFSNFKELNIKDYCSSNVHTTIPYLKIKLGDKKNITVRKSSLCWFFAQKTGRLSVDRIMRVRGPKTSKGDNKEGRNTERNTSKLAIQSKKNDKKVSKRYQERLSELDAEEELVYSETDSGTESEENSRENYSVRNTSDSEGEYISESEEMENSTPKIECEQYYAIYYENTWELGRVLKIKDLVCTVKFLKEDLSNFIWPKKNLIYDVEKKFIFYGPLKLNGTILLASKERTKCKLKKITKR